MFSSMLRSLSRSHARTNSAVAQRLSVPKTLAVLAAFALLVSGLAVGQLTPARALNQVADPEQTTLTVEPESRQTVGASYSATVTAKDAVGGLVGGVAVHFSLVKQGGTLDATKTSLAHDSCQTNNTVGDPAFGTCSVTLSSTDAGTFDIRAQVPDASGAYTDVKGSPASVVFTVGAFCTAPDTSSFAVAQTVGNDGPDQPYANGTDSWTGTLTAKDCDGNLLPGLKDVVFTPSETDVKVSAPKNNGDGTYTATFTAAKANPDYTVTAGAAGKTLSPARAIPFASVPDVSTPTPEPTSQATPVPPTSEATPLPEPTSPTTPAPPAPKRPGLRLGPPPVASVERLTVDEPDQTDAIAKPGDSASLTTNMRTTIISPKVDILFVLDTTNSMQARLNRMALGLAAFVDNVHAAGGTDLAVGVYAFGDIAGCWNPSLGKYDVSKWVSPMTPLTDTYTPANVANTLTNSLPQNYGCDAPEDPIWAAMTAASSAAWREGAERKLVIVTDFGSWERTSSSYYVNGQAATLANLQAYVTANAIDISVINASGFTVPESGSGVNFSSYANYVTYAKLASTFGSNPTAIPITTQEYVDQLTHDVVYGDGTTTRTIVPQVSITYDDGTPSTDVVATLTPSDPTDVGTTSVAFKLSATAKSTPDLVRPLAKTTVVAEYIDQTTGIIVARQTLAFGGAEPDPVKSALSVDTATSTVGHPVTATVTVVDADDNPLPGVTATVAVPDTTSATATGDSDVPGTSATCTTGADGRCHVLINDTVSEIVAVSAFVPVGGTPVEVSNSPIAVTFAPDHTTPVTPTDRLIVDPPEQSATIPSPGGTASLTTNMMTTTITPATTPRTIARLRSSRRMTRAVSTSMSLP